MGVFSEFCINPVRIITIATLPDQHGGDPRTPSAGTDLMASVQQASAQEARVMGLEAGEAAFKVKFDAEPLDTTADRQEGPSLRVADLIDWTTSTGRVRHLIVLGPVRDDGGAGLGWSVSCQEIA